MWKPQNRNKDTKDTKTTIKEKLEESAKIKKKQEVDKKALNIAFTILAIFCIAIFSFAIVEKAFQNDTFYTIKIGQLIRTNGIDYMDHFSWHENLPYMYPHWLYDVIISLIYDFCGGYTGIYISTIILSITMGILLYFTNKKISKNQVISFVITLGQMELMKAYIAARAQLVTFILFILAILLIEKFLEKPKLKYAIGLIIIPIIIANVHSAVWPFYFVLFLPYIGEYVVRVVIDAHIFHKLKTWFIKEEIKRTNKNLKKANKEQAKKYKEKLLKLNKEIEEEQSKFETSIIKQNDRRKKPYKLILERNDNVVKLIIIMIICLFTGLLTPIKDMPYMYTYKIMQGNTTQSISEHLPLTLIENTPILITLTLTIALAIFTKVKLRLRDIFFFAGLTLLALMSRRQVSMLVLFGGLVVTRILSDLIEKYDSKGTTDLMKYMTSVIGEILTILLIFAISYSLYRGNINKNYVSTSTYPVEATKWIKENLDYKEIKIFNDYNYGSYLLLNDIPVFIDSRCDLYTPEFNGTYNKSKKKYEGKDIFTDYINISSISTYYDTKFEYYGITHVMTKSNSKLNMLISRDSKYKQLYKDDHFVIYERLKE